MNINWNPMNGIESRYRYIEGTVLTYWNAVNIRRAIEKGLNSITITVDFGLRNIDVHIMGKGIEIDGILLDIDYINSIEEGFAYKVIDGVLKRIDLYDGGKYYKLKPIAIDKAPTLEINGIQMHRTVDVDPWTDSMLKVKTLGRLYGYRVLDICTGLGYTAIAEAMLGAREIVTIEIDPNVLLIASMNPWSRGLEDNRIRIILGNAIEVIKLFDEETFDAIIHDPPRFNIAGELYSLDFYRDLYRVLRRGGKLFHYTGEPGRHTNIDILKGIKNRLYRAGFDEIRWIPRAQGFIAKKI